MEQEIVSDLTIKGVAAFDHRRQPFFIAEKLSALFN
jgi:hypothetical protein